ncbi:Hypothetical protein Minf_0273 [Methylacidiphilum infernorum V4]|uniref:Uncharacterized protein n=1 Tax=Methylacidiphilum infernorum (isolate V4) TaxID=481448 RepID=B3DY56_METI4|nr:Hypothetical protein Minf_0273 [Methylacidiphilum infernorum V4]
MKKMGFYFEPRYRSKTKTGLKRVFFWSYSFLEEFPS